MRILLLGVATLVACGDGGGDDDGVIDSPVQVVSVHVEVVEGERLERQTYGDGVAPVDNASICENAVRIGFDGPLQRDAFEEIACADGSFALALVGCGAIGILDENDDGEADTRRLVDGLVDVVCPSGTAGPVLEATYREDLSELAVRFATLPSDAQCGLAFAQGLVDLNGNQPCGPRAGESTCALGDTSAIELGTDCVRVVATTMQTGATDVPVDWSANIAFNVPGVPGELLAGVALTDGAGDVTFSAETTADDNKVTVLRADLLSGTTYTLALPTGCGADRIETIEFTTASR